MKPELIKYTDRAIRDLVCQHALQMNPWLRMGEALADAVCTVQGGRLVPKGRPQAPPNVVHLDAVPPSILPQAPPPVLVSVRGAKLGLDDVLSFHAGALSGLDFKLREPTFLHPYELAVPHRDWLERYDAGDEVCVPYTDQSTFDVKYVATALTQAMIDDHAFAVFRFALSST
jgi:hypothetical protein